MGNHMAPPVMSISRLFSPQLKRRSIIDRLGINVFCSLKATWGYWGQVNSWYWREMPAVGKAFSSRYCLPPGPERYVSALKALQIAMSRWVEWPLIFKSDARTMEQRNPSMVAMAFMSVALRSERL